MTSGEIQLVLLSAAFWVAVALFRRREPEGEHGLRFLTGLALGASLAHLGWAALYADRVLAEPRWILAAAGFSALFVPLGLLATTPWGRPRAERERFLAAAFASLPLALATARVGCLVAGCCGGIPTNLPWGLRLEGDTVPRHPTVLYDIAGLVALQLIARRLPRNRVAPAILIGLGLLRLAIDPLRAAPPLGAPLVSPSWIAGLWIAVGLMIAWSRAPGRRLEAARLACR